MCASVLEMPSSLAPYAYVLANPVEHQRYYKSHFVGVVLKVTAR